MFKTSYRFTSIRINSKSAYYTPLRQFHCCILAMAPNSAFAAHANDFLDFVNASPTRKLSFLTSSPVLVC
jgi:hypothetical protein